MGTPDDPKTKAEEVLAILAPFDPYLEEGTLEAMPAKELNRVRTDFFMAQESLKPYVEVEEAQAVSAILDVLDEIAKKILLNRVLFFLEAVTVGIKMKVPDRAMVLIFSPRILEEPYFRIQLKFLFTPESRRRTRGIVPGYEETVQFVEDALQDEEGRGKVLIDRFKRNGLHPVGGGGPDLFPGMEFLVKQADFDRIVEGLEILEDESVQAALAGWLGGLAQGEESH